MLPNHSIVLLILTISFYYLFIHLFIFFEMGSCYVAQAGLEHLGLDDPLTSISKVAEIIGMFHYTWQTILIQFFLKNVFDRIQTA
jgi:hypothetical protein